MPEPESSSRQVQTGGEFTRDRRYIATRITADGTSPPPPSPDERIPEDHTPLAA